MGIVHIAMLFAVVVNIAMADVLIKKAAVDNHLLAAIGSPWMVTALLLYLSQVVALTYFFTKGWDISTIGVAQMAFYSVIVVAAGILFFGEVMTPLRLAGVGMAMAGVVLMNSN